MKVKVIVFAALLGFTMVGVSSCTQSNDPQVLEMSSTDIEELPDEELPE